MKLKLGVIDVPEPEGGTSYTVGKELEEKYQLFSKFAEYDMSNIVKMLSESAAGALETMQITGQMPPDPFAAAGEEITDSFKKFIQNETLASMGVPGVPTKAALEGRTLRTKGGKNVSKVKKGQQFKEIVGARRPSFIYSGVLQSSLKVWVD